jgi:hypothetical protein
MARMDTNEEKNEKLSEIIFFSYSCSFVLFVAKIFSMEL